MCVCVCVCMCACVYVCMSVCVYVYFVSKYLYIIHMMLMSVYKQYTYNLTRCSVFPYSKMHVESNPMIDQSSDLSLVYQNYKPLRTSKPLLVTSKIQCSLAPSASFFTPAFAHADLHVHGNRKIDFRSSIRSSQIKIRLKAEAFILPEIAQQDSPTEGMMRSLLSSSGETT